MIRNSYRNRQDPHCRHATGNPRGVAAVEFAVCLPVLVVLVLGTIECTNMIFVQQAMHVVAYEGARAAIDQNALPTDVTTRCADVIAERHLKTTTTTVIPSNIDALPAGDFVTVRVSLPYAANSVTGIWYLNNQLTAEVIMAKE